METEFIYLYILPGQLRYDLRFLISYLSKVLVGGMRSSFFFFLAWRGAVYE